MLTAQVTEFVVTVDLSNQATVWKLLCPFYTPTVTKQFTKQYGVLFPRARSHKAGCEVSRQQGDGCPLSKAG